jgi:hypothetical protein
MLEDVAAGHRLNRHCPPYARPSSNSSVGYHRNDDRTAENGFAGKSSVNKSAKVVLDGKILDNKKEICDLQLRHRRSTS